MSSSLDKSNLYELPSIFNDNVKFKNILCKISNVLAKTSGIKLYY